MQRARGASNPDSGGTDLDWAGWTELRERDPEQAAVELLAAAARVTQRKPQRGLSTDDVRQEVVLRILGGRANCPDPETSLHAWLTGIANNVSLEQVRRAARDRAAPEGNRATQRMRAPHRRARSSRLSEQPWTRRRSTSGGR